MPGESGWWCCCPGGPGENCDIGSDDFNRANSTNIGSDWSEDAGDWSISSNQLYTGDASAKTTYQTAHPDSVAHHYVSVTVTFATHGDVAKIFLSDNVRVEVLYNSSGPHTVSIYDNGSLEDYAYHVTSSNTFVIVASYIESIGVAAAYIESFTNCVSAKITGGAATTYDVALGTGTNSGGIYFDDFDYQMGYHPNDPLCPRVVCLDDCAGCLPDTGSDLYLVEIPSIANDNCADCSSYAGSYVLYFDYELGTYCYFEHVAGTNPGSCCSSGVFSIAMTIQPYGTISVTATLTGTGSDCGKLWRWEYWPGTPAAIDCDFDDFELPVSNATIYDSICDGSGTSVYVSEL